MRNQEKVGPFGLGDQIVTETTHGFFFTRVQASATPRPPSRHLVHLGLTSELRCRQSVFIIDPQWISAIPLHCILRLSLSAGVGVGSLAGRCAEILDVRAPRWRNRAANKRYRRAQGDTRVTKLGYLGLPRLDFGRAHSGTTPFCRQTQPLGSCLSETGN